MYVLTAVFKLEDVQFPRGKDEQPSEAMMLKLNASLRNTEHKMTSVYCCRHELFYFSHVLSSLSVTLSLGSCVEGGVPRYWEKDSAFSAKT